MPIETKKNEIRARINMPQKYSKMRTINISRTMGIMAIYGKLKNSEKWEIQSYRFDKNKWTTDSVGKWLKNKGVTPI